MKIAVFSDVHGNLIALEQFIRVTQNSVDAYVCLGDVVDYGPWNDECLEIIWALPNITIIEGNHERLFMDIEDIDHQLPLVKDFFYHSRKFFSREDLITNLPHHFDLGIFECVHTINGQSIYQDTPIEIGHNYMIGHTHHQFQITRSGFIIVNPGSVGQNRKWIDRVDYSILDTENGDIYMYSVPYNVDQFLIELRLRYYPAHCIAYYANKPRKG